MTRSASCGCYTSQALPGLWTFHSSQVNNAMGPSKQWQQCLLQGCGSWQSTSNSRTSTCLYALGSGQLCVSELQPLTSGSSQYRRLPRPSNVKGGLMLPGRSAGTAAGTSTALPAAAECRGPAGPTCAAERPGYVTLAADLRAACLAAALEERSLPGRLLLGNCGDQATTLTCARSWTVWAQA